MSLGLPGRAPDGTHRVVVLQRSSMVRRASFNEANQLSVKVLDASPQDLAADLRVIERMTDSPDLLVS